MQTPCARSSAFRGGGRSRQRTAPVRATTHSPKAPRPKPAADAEPGTVPAVDLLAAGAALLEIRPRPSYGPHAMTETAAYEQILGPLKLIERPRLTELLDGSDSRIITLVAPAGYGKTTLTRQWMASRPHAWYEGSASSGDVAALALGIADAVEPLVSD